MRNQRWKSSVLLLIWGLGCATANAPGERAELPGQDLKARRSVRPRWTLETRSYLVDGRAAEGKRAFEAGRYSRSRLLWEGAGDTAPVQFMRALAALRSNDPKTATREFLELSKSYPALKDYCLLYAAMGQERSGAVDAAIATYQTVSMESAASAEARLALIRLKGATPAKATPAQEDDHSESAPVFQSFWELRRKGDARGALDLLERAELDDESQRKAEYWRARLFEDRGERARAAAIYSSLAEAAPGTYYGSLAAQHVAATALPKSISGVAPTTTESTSRVALTTLAKSTRRDAALESLFADPNFAAGVELLRLGLPEAMRELSRVELSNKPADAKPLYLRVLFDGGNKKQVALLSSTGSLTGAPTWETAPVWRVAFPHAFRNEVERSAARQGIDPNLLQALVREESRFNPNTRSKAGALGLAQLLPSTAELIAGTKVSEEQLFNPEQNLHFAALYLSAL
ncbi:MAG: transglycosylase SLT domain-containing protein, partial [Myxococcaceae bacterium]